MIEDHDPSSMKRALLSILACAFASASCHLLLDLKGDLTIGMDAAVDRTAGDAAMKCDPSAPFQTPVLLAEISTPDYDHGLRFTPDRGIAYFSRSQRGNISIWENSLLYASTVTIADGEHHFGPAKPLLQEINDGGVVDPDAGVNTPNVNPFPFGNELYFDSYRYRNAKNKARGIWRVTINPPAYMPTFVDVKNNDECYEPYLVAGAMYFTGRQVVDGSCCDTDVFRVELFADGGVGQSARVEGIDTFDHNETAPVVTPDELDIFWARKNETSGVVEIHTAYRTTTKEPFANDRVLEELRLGYQHRPTWVTSDGCTLYLTADNLTTNTSYDLYVAERVR